MKRVCFLSGDITRSGGTEKVACQIMNGLRNIFKVSVISLTESSDKIFFDLSSDIEHKALFRENPNGKKQFFSIVHKIRSYIVKEKIDVLVDIDTIMDMFSVPAVIGLKTKLISWEHFNFNETMGNKLRVPIRKYFTRFSDCIVTLTKEDQTTYKQYFRKKEKIIQIYNPFEFKESSKQYDATSKQIISVGRLAHQKGFDILIDVAEKVLKKHSDWEWFILGEGEERQYLEKNISHKSLTHLHLLGKVSNVREYLEKSSIYVMTSRYEGFPLVLIEAKENNLPVVSFNCKTGPAELVKDGINGYLIDCFDIDLMTEKICKLINNVELRKQFSRNSLLGTQELNYNRIINQWIDLIESMHNSLWNKLFCKDIIQDCVFDEDMKLAEDLYFCLDAYKLANTYQFIDSSPYHYSFVNVAKKYMDNSASESIHRNIDLCKRLIQLGKDKKSAEVELKTEIIRTAYASLSELIFYSSYSTVKKGIKDWLDNTILGDSISHRNKNFDNFQIKTVVICHKISSRLFTYMVFKLIKVLRNLK